MAGKHLFVDSNVLVYANYMHSPFCAPARAKLTALAPQFDAFWISRQVIREYLVAMSIIMLTTIKRVDYQVLENNVQDFLKGYSVADDVSDVTLELLPLIRSTSTAGKNIHDANIVATMLTNGIDTLLTNNLADFKRFSRLIQIEPLV